MNVNNDMDFLDVSVLELLASRICHDIISPVGAIHNGVEFLEEMGPDAGQEAVSLLAHSAKTAAAKLTLFRLAYGAGGRDPNIKPEDVYNAFEDLITIDGKVAQTWDPHMDFGYEERPDGFCKMLAGCLMLAQESLPKGGEIVVESPEAGTVNVIAVSPDTLIREQVEEALNLELSPDDLDPRLVHPYVMAVLAKQYRFELNIAEKQAERVTYNLKYRV